MSSASSASLRGASALVDHGGPASQRPCRARDARPPARKSYVRRLPLPIRACGRPCTIQRRASFDGSHAAFTRRHRCCLESSTCLRITTSPCHFHSAQDGLRSLRATRAAACHLLSEGTKVTDAWQALARRLRCQRMLRSLSPSPTELLVNFTLLGLWLLHWCRMVETSPPPSRRARGSGRIAPKRC